MDAGHPWRRPDVRDVKGWSRPPAAPGDFSLATQAGSRDPYWIVADAERSRGNAVRRALVLLADLMRGAEHTRHTVKKVAGLEEAAASRQLEALKTHVPGVVSEVRNKIRIYRFDPDSVSVKRVQRLARPIVAAACFGTSLANLFEGSRYAVAMREALDHLLAQGRRGDFRDVARKFWFVKRGGEVSLPQNRHLLDEVIDAILQQNVTIIKYEHFEGGEADVYRIQPLSVVVYTHQLYVIGKTDSQEMRFFRFSRLQDVERTDDTFSYPGETEYNPEQLLRDSFGIFVGDKYPICDVAVRLASRWASFVRSHRWHPSQLVTREGDHVVIRLRVRVCPELEGWILSFGEDAEVLSPAFLRDKIGARVRGAGALYAAADEPDRE